MSGGAWDYEQYKIDQIAGEVKHLIESNEDTSLNEWGYPCGNHYPPEVIAEFKRAYKTLREAAIYAQRIDWLISGDDGEDSFILRLKEDLATFSSAFKLEFAIPITEHPIMTLDISVRAGNCLIAEGISTVGDLCSKTREDLYKVVNIGKRSCNEIEEALSARGLKLKDA